MEIQIVNIHDFKGEHIYVGRGSPLGNPFSNRISKFEVYKVATRSEAIEKYRIWLNEQLKFDTPQSRAIMEIMAKLVTDNKIVLGCFCVPQKCHASVIAEVLKERFEETSLKWKQIFD